MGRPEPCVLFAQTFVHPLLDEYVDEVIFAEPIVITACEFLEQNAASASPVITLVGATSPPSFALEVFVQCEGEPRFRRLCLPFLYSHSSSNVLEVEAVVTSHLVVRGSYRSLTLVVYGNTAEDLGQFNIEFDLDSSLANLVCSPSEGKLEDLPPALRSAKLSFEESISSLKSLNLSVAVPDLSIEMKQFLHFILRILDTSDLGDGMHRVVSTVVSAVASYVSNDLRCTAITWNQCNHVDSKTCGKELHTVLTESRNELLELHKMLQNESVSESGSLFTELLEEGVNFETDLATTTAELLRDVLNQYFLSERKSPTNGLPLLSQNNSVIVGLSVVLLLCSGSESCFHFVNCGGMVQLARVFNLETLKSTAVMLMLLGVIERATRFAIGCEGFLGWWPREDENVPVGSSDGYSEILKLLLQKQRHDVASLATYVLHRLRLYEVASRYESAVLSLLGGVSGMGGVTSVSVNMLVNVKLQLKNLLKLLKSTGSIQDPSPVAHASRSLILGETEGCLSYKATINLVTSSDCCFSNFDIDPHLLSLLKERGFLPLSAALLSSTILRSEKGHMMNIYVDIAASIEAILLSLLFCRSGLVFLLLQPEVTAAVILSLQGVEDMNKEECVPLRYASVLISKGFFCRPQDVGMITELHLRMVNAVDRLLTSIPHSEELLWVLWELCGLSRSDSGRQALLALGHFPEAVLVLMEALRSAKDLEPVALNSGASPLDIAIFHSAAELFEVIVTDSMASSLGSWIQHAVELHRALHSSSPGSNKKDTPTRLLEWIDAGVVYHRNGAIGLLRYAAVLASGGDAHLTSTSILVSDSMDVENVVGDSSNGSDIQVIENLLGKLVSDKYFDGVALRDSSIAQLTTTFRILAFISENSAVAAALYEEGAVTLIYVVLVNCKFMLERSSNSYDYLVDEGAECNSTSDLLSERSREQSLVDLMIPSLVLLVTLLQKLQEAKEQHRNTKLLNALLRLHREVSPKLAACAADLSSPYPVSALGLGAVCHLLVSALACWPVFGWTPGLFHCLLDSVQATSSLALGPKEACSLLCLLGDLFPEEGIWLWKNGMPSLSAIRTLAIGTLLGPQKERQVSWYLQPRHVATLLSRLTPLLEKIAQIIMHFAFTAMVVIQDMLRVFIIRIACQKSDSAVVLLRPIMLWIRDHVSESSPLSDTYVFKVYRLLDFLASLLEHPRAKSLLLREGVIGILIKALERCSDSSNSEGKIFSESSTSVKSEFTQLSWCIPVSKSLAVICSSLSSSQHSEIYDDFKRLSTKDCSLILHHLLKLFQVLPVGKELLACLIAFRELASCSEGRSAFASISVQSQSSSLEDLEPERGHEQDGNDNNLDEFDWRRCPPLLCCWRNLLRSIDSKDGLSTYAIEAVSALSSGALHFSMESKNLNMEGIAVLKFLFGLPLELHGMEHIPSEKIQDVCELITLLDTRLSPDEHLATLNVNTTLSQVKEVAKSLLLLLQKSTGSIKVDDIISSEGFTSSSTDVLDPSKVVPPQFLFPSLNIMSTLNEDSVSSLSRIRKSDSSVDKAEDCLFLGGLADKFVWECPDSLRDRLSMSDLPTKRKMASMEGPSRRSRGDNSGAETGGPNVFSRGSGPPTASSGPTRRDTFRQRKPNTSRPPSMHVDDYVARERNVDGGASSGSNIVSSVQRGGSTGGRPPSIHVDEFIARQRERQIPVPVTVGEVTAQVRDTPSEIDLGSEKIDKSRQLKADLDDDLQEINIVFDDEESESEDRLPFPQPDDNLQPSSLIIEESSTHSIVEETEVDVNGSTQVSNLGTPLASNIDENTQSEFSSRSVSRPEIPLSREASVSSEKYFGTNTERAFFREQSDDTKHIVPVMASSGSDSATTANLSGFPSPFYNKGSASSVQPFGESRMPPPTFYRRDSPQQASNVPLATGSQGLYDQKHVLSQPPLPPLPPPLSVLSQNTETVQNHLSPYGQPPLPTGYPLQAFEVSGPSTVQPFHIREDRPSLNNFASSTSFADSSIDPINSQLQTDYMSTFNNTTSHPMLDSKYPWASISSSSRLHDEMNSSTSGASRPPPPLPPMPPPFSVPSITQASIKSSTSQSGYNQTNIGTGQLLQNSPLSDARLGTFSASGGSLTSYSPPQLVPPMLINRPASMPGPLFSSPTQHQSQNPQPSIQSLQPRPQLQPLQPPQPPHPHPSQHLRPLIQISQQQSEQGLPLLQSPIQIQGQSSQMHQQPHISPIQVYYQAQQDHLSQSQQQQQQVEHVQPQTLHQQGDASQQQQDSGMTLQQYFSSPEAIQSLLSDREKLCQLLEQHPKLMQMLQERLGQL